MDRSRIKREYIEPAKPFTLKAPFTPKGDQPQAVASLVDGLKGGEWAQVLWAPRAREKRSPWRR